VILINRGGERIATMVGEGRLSSHIQIISDREERGISVTVIANFEAHEELNEIIVLENGKCVMEWDGGVSSALWSKSDLLLF
jgi:hypothetical protein